MRPAGDGQRAGEEVAQGEQSDVAMTSLENNGPFPNLAGPGPIALELSSPGGHVHLVGAPGDAILGPYPDGHQRLLGQS